MLVLRMPFREWKRREFITLLGGAALAGSTRLRAQQNIPLVGFLVLGSAVQAKNLAVSSELARIGYFDGRNISFEIRAANGDLSRLPKLAQDLVAKNPRVLVSASTLAAQALAAVTRDIPIVVTVTIDPVAAGLSDSLARPSRNVTGFTSSVPALVAKRLELLHQLVEGLRRVAYVSVPEGPAYEIFEPHIRAATRALGVTVVAIPITTATAQGVAEAFQAVDAAKIQAVLVGLHPAMARLSGHIVSECLVRNLPSIHPWSFEVQAGALISYGPAALENHAGAARYIDRILKGAKISELPFQEPTDIKLAINLRTARSMNITIPPALLAFADEVVE
jgi:putative tryptophan/tyrosine transport system substrate-binding protein